MDTDGRMDRTVPPATGPPVAPNGPPTAGQRGQTVPPTAGQRPQTGPRPPGGGLAGRRFQGGCGPRWSPGSAGRWPRPSPSRPGSRPGWRCAGAVGRRPPGVRQGGRAGAEPGQPGRALLRGTGHGRPPPLGPGSPPAVVTGRGRLGDPGLRGRHGAHPPCRGGPTSSAGSWPWWPTWPGLSPRPRPGCPGSPTGSRTPSPPTRWPPPDRLEQTGAPGIGGGAGPTSPAGVPAPRRLPQARGAHRTTRGSRTAHVPAAVRDQRMRTGRPMAIRGEAGS